MAYFSLVRCLAIWNAFFCTVVRETVLCISISFTYVIFFSIALLIIPFPTLPSGVLLSLFSILVVNLSKILLVIRGFDLGRSKLNQLCFSLLLLHECTLNQTHSKVMINSHDLLLGIFWSFAVFVGCSLLGVVQYEHKSIFGKLCVIIIGGLVKISICLVLLNPP